MPFSRKPSLIFFVAILVGLFVANESGLFAGILDLTVKRSHIEGNVPEEGFELLLNRELSTHFSNELQRSDLKVDFKLLRKLPTQTGIAFPKFYCWIVVRDLEGKIITSGAARVAAIDKVEFDVTDYLDRERVNSSPESVEYVFPAPLVEKIRELAKANPISIRR
ncbi:MAG: hypothetical protein J0L82_07205 [Deltaproteobacteria bacterium]|jgi:hypothetical protein|nr:hypothetical protein [Deltaproteobacteria bacterium]